MRGRFAGRGAAVMATRAAAAHATVIEMCRRPRHGGMTIRARRRGDDMGFGFSGSRLAIVTTRATGGRTVMIEARRRPRAAGVAVAARVAAGQMIGRLGTRRDRAAGDVAALTQLRRLLEDAFDVAGFARRLFMRADQRKAGYIVIEVLGRRGGHARTDQRHAQQR